MSKIKIQDIKALREEMVAVARGDRPPPPDANVPSFNSAEALVRLLTPQNRELLALIRDRKPGSLAELEKWSGRAQSNLSRTLAKLEAAGLIAMTDGDGRRRRVPVARIQHITVEIDPYSNNDQLCVR